MTGQNKHFFLYFLSIYVLVLGAKKRNRILFSFIPTYQLIIRRNSRGDSLFPYNAFAVCCIKQSGGGGSNTVQLSHIENVRGNNLEDLSCCLNTCSYTIKWMWKQKLHEIHMWFIMTAREKLPFNIFRVTVNNKRQLRNSGKKTICQKLSNENT